MIVDVEIGAALRRPPGVDRISKVRMAVPPVITHDQIWLAENYARLMAIYMVQARDDVVMVTSATVTGLEM